MSDVEPDWKNFAKAVLADWPTGDLEGSVLFDLSLQYGMIKEVPGGYNSEHHSDNDGIFPEEGDPWYEYTFDGGAGPGLYSITSLTEQLTAARHDAKEAEAYAEEVEQRLSICERHRDAYAEMDRIGTQAVRDLEAKLAKAVEALEPFARAAETWEPDDGDSGLGARIEHPHHGLERHAEFTFGDLRRARTTLAEIKGESHD